MKRFFDYMYYRVSGLYGTGDQWLNAIVILFLVQSLLIISAVEVIALFFFDKDAIKQLLTSNKWLVAIVILPTAFVNFHLYKNKYAEFHSRWQSENKLARKLRGAVMAAVIVISFVIFHKTTTFLYTK